MILFGHTNCNRHRRPALVALAAALLCSGAAAQSLGDTAREERQRSKTASTRTYSDDDSAKTPASAQTAADVPSKPSGPSSRMRSTRQTGYQPQPSTAELRQACRRELGSRMEAAKRGNLDEQAEVCVLLERPMDPAYEALVDRSLTLQNEICPRIYPLGLDSAKVAADPVLGPKVQELRQLAREFGQRMDGNTQGLTRLLADKGQAADSNPEYIEYKFRALRMQIDLGRLGGNCSRGF